MDITETYFHVLYGPLVHLTPYRHDVFTEKVLIDAWSVMVGEEMADGRSVLDQVFWWEQERRYTLEYFLSYFASEQVLPLLAVVPDPAPTLAGILWFYRLKPHAAHLGLWVRRKQHPRITDAILSQGCAWAFQECGWQVILAESPHRSVALAVARQAQRQQGWRGTGHKPHYAALDKGRYADLRLFALTRQDWEQSHG